MVSDVLFATMPILLVWGLTRSKMEKLLLSVLLGLGLLGVIAGGVKLQTLKLFRVGSKNIVAEMMPVYMVWFNFLRLLEVRDGLIFAISGLGSRRLSSSPRPVHRCSRPRSRTYCIAGLAFVSIPTLETYMTYTRCQMTKSARAGVSSSTVDRTNRRRKI